jgi:hypothetical protein
LIVLLIAGKFKPKSSLPAHKKIVRKTPAPTTREPLPSPTTPPRVSLPNTRFERIRAGLLDPRTNPPNGAIVIENSVHSGAQGAQKGSRGARGLK